jgi:hypothetical protein
MNAKLYAQDGSEKGTTALPMSCSRSRCTSTCCGCP